MHPKRKFIKVSNAHLFFQIKNRKVVQVRKKGNKKTLYECLFGRIEWDSPISERASELAKSEACRPKGGSHGKAVIVCAKGEHNQVHKKGNKKNTLRVFVW